MNEKMLRYGGLCLALVLAACPSDEDPATTDGDTDADTDPSGGSTSMTTTPTTSGTSPTTDPGTTTTDPSTTDPTDPDTTSSTTTPAESSTSGDESGTTTGPGGAMVTGVVIRSVEPAAGNDAIGDLYVGLLAECSQGAESVGDGDMIMDADLSGDMAMVMYTITDVPDGTYYVVAFLDDNQNTDPEDPGPDQGDLAAAMGFGPACVEVTITDGQDVVAPDAVDLNTVVPF